MLHNGQASVERGFSLNKEVISTNMGEMTIRSQRMIKDHLYANSLEPSTRELSSALLKFVKFLGPNIWHILSNSALLKMFQIKVML